MWFSKKQPKVEEGPVKALIPPPKVPFNCQIDEELTTGEAMAILAYLRYCLKMYGCDYDVGYVDGMNEYLFKRMGNAIQANRFKAGGVYLKKDEEEEKTE